MAAFFIFVSRLEVTPAKTKDAPNLNLFRMKVALVTGATSGFGKAVAEKFSAEGYKVYGFGRTVQESTNGIHYLQMDVTDDASVDAAMQKVLTESPKIEVLVNCAGHGIAGPSEEIPIENIMQTFDVNFMGTTRMIQKVLPAMRTNGGGKIFNFSSIGGYIALPFQAYYSATKFAIEGFSEALSIEVKPFNVKVIIIEPGDFKTGAAKNRNMFAPKENSVYTNRLQTFFDYLNTRIDKGGKPENLANSLYKIAQRKCPKFRYKFGSPLEMASKPIHAVLPVRWWERLMNKFYNI